MRPVVVAVVWRHGCLLDQVASLTVKCSVHVPVPRLHVCLPLGFEQDPAGMHLLLVSSRHTP
jgi:hypothetical protein